MITALFIFFFLNDTATTEIYTLSLHDALPISAFQHHQGMPVRERDTLFLCGCPYWISIWQVWRSEEHTSELQSRRDLVCRLLLEKKNNESSRLLLLWGCAPSVSSAGQNEPKQV